MQLIPPGLMPERVRTALNAILALTQAPAASVTPSENGDLAIEATNNTTLKFKLKGSDGVVRSGTVTLS